MAILGLSSVVATAGLDPNSQEKSIQPDTSRPVTVLLGRDAPPNDPPAVFPPDSGEGVIVERNRLRTDPPALTFPEPAEADPGLKRRPSARGGRANEEAPARSVLPAALPATVTVPILMYHHIAEAEATADAVRRDLSVSPANFAAQMAYLAKHGYHTIPLSDLLAHLQTGAPLPARPVILTFDDGYGDNYTHAFPLLRQYGFRGTFFIITDFLDKKGYLTWGQVKEMHEAGMEIGSHTLDHPDLTRLPSQQALRQLRESRLLLEARLGKPVQFLAYPSGKYNQTVIGLAQEAGYRAAVATTYGDTHTIGQVFRLARIRIRGSDNLKTFAEKVGGPQPEAAATRPTPAQQKGVE